MPKVTVLGSNTAGTKIQVFYLEVQQAMVGRTASQRKESFQIGCWLGVVDYPGKNRLRSHCESTGTMAASRRQKKNREAEDFHCSWKAGNSVHKNIISLIRKKEKILKAEGKSPVHTNINKNKNQKPSRPDQCHIKGSVGLLPTVSPG